jgi:outer membrane protein, heavy metal efflux system
MNLLKVLLRVSRSQPVLLTIAVALATLESQAETIDLATVIIKTQSQNPQLLAYPFAIREIEALKLQAEQKPLSEVILEVENVAGTGPFKKADSAEVTLSFGQTLELGNKRDKRLAIQSSEQQRLAIEFQVTELQILAEAHRRYLYLLYQQETIDLIQEQVQEVKSALQTTEIRAAAGSILQADVSKMELTLSKLYLKIAETEIEVKRASSRLSVMWLEHRRDLKATGNLSDIPAQIEIADIERLVQGLPLLKELAAQVKVREAELQIALATGTADPKFSVGVRHVEESGDQALVFGFSMPVSLRNFNQGNIDAAQSRIAWQRQSTSYTTTELKIRLLSIGEDLEAAITTRRYLQSTLLASAETLLKDTQHGYTTGQSSVLQLIDAQTELYRIKEKIRQNALSIHLLVLEHESITGTSMTQGAGA